MRRDQRKKREVYKPAHNVNGSEIREPIFNPGLYV